MLLKALFTILAILWIIQALRPYMGVQQGPNLRYKQAPPKNDRNDDDDEGEYIDYEEIK
ncbi:MAG: hypothetical protein H6574_13385 [Lewinellaceae bacterium]|nr:hypothetical protein [Saprospiraceae bacterium]MCB9332069.1 hypothetical protein [Lewinellaceae bacterium]